MDIIIQRVEEGDHYGALQTLKALLVRAKKKNDIERVNEFGKFGAVILLEKGYGQAALDVCTDMIDIWTDKKVHISEETVSIVQTIADAFSQDLKNTSEKANEEDSDPLKPFKLNQAFLKLAIEWSKPKVQNQDTNIDGLWPVYKKGEPRFNFLAANNAIKLGDGRSALDYFVNAQQPVAFAEFLKLLSERGYKNENDLFVAKGVLMLLCQENLKEANEVYAAFLKDLDPTEADTPMFNFLKFLLKTMERDAYPLFNTLREKYAPVLSADPLFSRYLDIIAERFFKVKPNKGGMAAMMENMMSMFAQ